MKPNQLLLMFGMLACLAGSTLPLHAQFKLTAEVRPRTEFRQGFKTPTSDGFEPAFFTEQRSRLYFDYKEEKYKFRVSLQDVRIWGEVPQIFKQEDGNTFLSEAWGQYYFTKELSVKAGRQIISYDNQRFLGGLEWAQQGRRHDAFLFAFEDDEKDHKLHLAVAMNADDETAEPGNLQGPNASYYAVAGNYKNMQYAWYHKGSDKGAISLLALNAQYQNRADTSVFAKQTLGAVGSLKFGKVTVGGDLYYQTGKQGSADVNAWLAGANVTLKTKLTPLKLGVEYISGKNDTDGADDLTVTNFSPDFGTNHAHNGFMDYFFVGPANGNVGVTDIYLKTKWKLKKGALIANFHEFLTGSTQLDGNGNELAKPMGFEADLVYAVKLAPSVTFNLGYSHLVASETMLSLRPGNAQNNHWGWMMITFKPTLYQTPKPES
ncbi:alginate export family protein [Pontibacter sp. G13]|uniref:alginate export family protein n=1 Tax=Pontibacter sp. G13 TaxID=3074898 RepID=UPI00288A4242|nr:alginate export family protein [Pontibacter sp. G13]WNJ17844.1 alginate export family protein [Pontibacter sp. G13]